MKPSKEPTGEFSWFDVAANAVAMLIQSVALTAVVVAVKFFAGVPATSYVNTVLAIGFAAVIGIIPFVMLRNALIKHHPQAMAWFNRHDFAFSSLPWAFLALTLLGLNAGVAWVENSWHGWYVPALLVPLAALIVHLLLKLDDPLPNDQPSQSAEQE